MSLAAVLFDNDGLTLDTEPAWTRAETTLFARHGSTFTMEHKRSLLGTAPPVAAAKLEAMLGVPGDVLNAELHELVLVEVAAGVEPMPGAVDLLSALRAAGRAGRAGLELAAELRRERPALRRAGEAPSRCS